MPSRPKLDPIRGVKPLMAKAVEPLAKTHPPLAARWHPTRNDG